MPQNAIHYRGKRRRHRPLHIDNLAVFVGIHWLQFNVTRQWRDCRRVDQRQADMTIHDGANAGVNRSAERNQFDGVKTFARNVDLRKPTMRIGGCIAMSGKMFGCGDNAGVLRAINKCGNEPGDIFWIFAVRSDVDYRVRRIVVDVGNRRVNLLHAKGARFASS